MHVCLDEDVHATYSIERDLGILVTAPIAHLGHVCAPGLDLFVSFCDDDVLVKACCKLEPLIGLLPRVVVEATFNVDSVFVSVEPYVCLLVSRLCPPYGVL